MKKINYEGTCLETGEKLIGSLIQFEDGTHTIMFKEVGGKGITSPVDPESVIPVSLYEAMKKYNSEVVSDPDNFNYDFSEENKHIDQVNHLLDLI